MHGDQIDEDALLESDPEDEEGEESDEDSSSEDSSDDDLEDEDEEEDDGPLAMLPKTDFIATTPDDSNKEGIENLLKQLFKYMTFDIKDFGNILIEQNYVTTILTDDSDNEVEEEEDEFAGNTGNTVYGVFSAVNLKLRKDSTSVKQLIAYIFEHCGKKVDGDFFKDVLNNQSTQYLPAFLIKEKVVNIPGIATGPLMKQLMNDLKDANDKGMQYNFTHYLLMAKMLRIKNQDDYFVDQEDEIIHKHHNRFFDVKFDSSIDAKIVFQNDKGKNLKGESFRRVYILTSDQLKAFMDEMTSLEPVHNLMEEAGHTGLQI